jgi:DNA-binding MarR family transcriptional regulator
LRRGEVAVKAAARPSTTERHAPFSVRSAEESTGFLLFQVTAVWQRRVAAALREHDLTQAQYALLAGLLWLSRNERDVTQARLARHARLDVMMTSQVLRTLEARGLVERLPHPDDARAKVLRLTNAGRARAFRAVPDVEAADARFFGARGAQQGRFNRLLRALLAG